MNVGRYHLWRAFWQPIVGGNICELCTKIHTSGNEQHSHHVDIHSEREAIEGCRSPPDDIKSWWLQH